MNEQPQPRAVAGPSQIVAALCGLATFILSFAVIGVVLIQGVALTFELRAPNDPSAGDPAGWLIVFAWPLLWAADLMLSAGVAAMVCTRRSRQKAAQGERRDHPGR
jgi:hypothetical protein